MRVLGPWLSFRVSNRTLAPRGRAKVYPFPAAGDGAGSGGVGWG